MVHAHGKTGDDFLGLGKGFVKVQQVLQIHLADARYRGRIGALGIGHCQCLVEAIGVRGDEGVVPQAAMGEVTHQAVEEPHIRARLDGQVQVRQFAGRGAARIDHDQAQGRAGFLQFGDALEEDGMAPRGIGSDQHDQVGQLQVFIADRHQVFTEGAFVAGHRRGHAQPRIGIDVGAADVALHELVGDVVVLGQQLSRDIQGHGIRTMFGDDGRELARHLVKRLIPRYLLQCALRIAHLRMQQTAIQIHRFGEGRAFHAQAAEVGGMLHVALHADAAIVLERSRHAAAHAAVGAGGRGGGHGQGQRGLCKIHWYPLLLIAVLAAMARRHAGTWPVQTAVRAGRR